MQGRGALASISTGRRPLTVCRASAARLMPSSETPSAVDGHSSSTSAADILRPWYSHTICRQAMPHCMASCCMRKGKTDIESFEL